MRSVQTLAVAFPSSRQLPLTGQLELRLDAVLSAAMTRPERVSAILSCVFGQIGGHPANADTVRRLATGAREWLLHRAATLFFRDSGWFETRCEACDEAFDLPMRLSEAPRSDAGTAFPVVEVETSLGARQFEVPNGHHEEQLAQAIALDPARQLVAFCGLAKTAVKDAASFSDADIAAIDAALDAITPDVASEIASTCPACSAQTTSVIDPLAFAFPKAESLLRECHLLARGYGWDEPTILELSSHRRRQYAGMIAADFRAGRGRR